MDNEDFPGFLSIWIGCIVILGACAVVNISSDNKDEVTAAYFLASLAMILFIVLAFIMTRTKTKKSKETVMVNYPRLKPWACN